MSKLRKRIKSNISVYVLLSHSQFSVSTLFPSGHCGRNMGFHFFVVTQKSRIIVIIIIISCSTFIESRTRNCTKAMLPHIHKLISIRVLSTNGIRDDNFEYLNMPPPTTKLYLFIPNTHTPSSWCQWCWCGRCWWWWWDAVNNLHVNNSIHNISKWKWRKKEKRKKYQFV